MIQISWCSSTGWACPTEPAGLAAHWVVLERAAKTQLRAVNLAEAQMSTQNINLLHELVSTSPAESFSEYAKLRVGGRERAGPGQIPSALGPEQTPGTDSRQLFLDNFSTCTHPSPTLKSQPLPYFNFTNRSPEESKLPIKH